MEELEKDVKKPFYIFLSDDTEFIEHAFQNIKKEDKYISNNKPVVDLSLMSLCHYGICSNSTFAWWGSFLMEKKVKIIFPKYWMGWKLNEESHPGIQPSWSTIIDFN